MIPHKVWRVYFFFAIALMLAVMAFDFSNSTEYRVAIDTMDYLVSVIGAVGLYGYVFSRKSISAAFWKNFLFLALAWEIFVFIYDYIIDPDFGGLWVSLAVLVFYVIWIGPLYIAVWRYGFKRDDIWKSPR